MKRNTRKVQFIDLTKPIPQPNLARALLQYLLQGTDLDRNKLKATASRIEDAIARDYLKPIPGKGNSFSWSELFGWARDHKWKRSLAHLNELCVQRQPGNSTVLTTPEMMRGCVGSLDVSIRTRDPDTLSERVDELIAENDKLKAENSVLKTTVDELKQALAAHEAHRAKISEKNRKSGERAWSKPWK